MGLPFGREHFVVVERMESDEQMDTIDGRKMN